MGDGKHSRSITGVKLLHYSIEYNHSEPPNTADLYWKNWEGSHVYNQENPYSGPKSAVVLEGGGEWVKRRAVLEGEGRL